VKVSKQPFCSRFAVLADAIAALNPRHEKKTFFAVGSSLLVSMLLAPHGDKRGIAGWGPLFSDSGLAKLPPPAEWVNVRRVRVKDAVNCIWWLLLTPCPKANNRRVRALYSDSMLDLLQKRLRTDALQGNRAFLALQEISGSSGRHAYRSGNRIASGVQANRPMLSCRLL